MPAKIIEARETLPTIDDGSTSLERIHRRGVLRVGYWYRGVAEEKHIPRWSVLRNVLGWGEVGPTRQASDSRS